MIKTDKQKERIMQKLGVTAEQADEILAYDKAVDRGEKTEYDLTKEQEKVVKEMKNSKSHNVTGVYNLNKRERKENPTKASIVRELSVFLANDSGNACEKVEITNKERQISFWIGEQQYELTLVAKRMPKK